jgi:hypothetical protein
MTTPGTTDEYPVIVTLFRVNVTACDATGLKAKYAQLSFLLVSGLGSLKACGSFDTF